jgi:diacylglycerol kinase family enzyme
MIESNVKGIVRMADRTTKIAVLLNIAAGKAETGPRPEEIKEAFGDFRIEPRIWTSRSGADLSQAAKEALSLDYPIIVAAGGDGTVSRVAGILAGTDSALGLLPTGTLNHFARDLNLPLDLREAVEIIAAGYTAAIDVGKVNDRIFINNASIGIYPALLRYRERLQKRGLSKWPAFASAVLAVLVKPPPLLRVRLQVAQEKMEAQTTLLLVGNNEYEMSGWQIGSRQRLDAGTLSLYFTGRTTKSGLTGLLFRTFLDIPPKEADFVGHCTREVWIDTDRKVLKAGLDGELVDLTTPLHFRIQPGSLKVVVRK